MGAPGFRVELRKGNDIIWIILQGEADLATLEGLEVALEHAPLERVRSIHLHVKDLDFVDATALRQLTVFAKRARLSGRHVTTCGANSTFRLLARLLRARRDLGLPEA
jgi:anti-anti-sigma factor